MLTGALSECRNPRCGNYAVDGGRGYCHEHTDPARESRSPAGLNLTPSNGRFRKLRRAFLMRYPICNACHIEPATDLDHIVPHRGNARLFWDQANWQGLCHRCHAQKTYSETLGRSNPVQRPAVPGHLVVLMGAPGSGKSTYAEQQSGVVVVSTDALQPGATRDDVGAVFEAAFARMVRLLSEGRRVVFDTTAAHPGIRRQAIAAARRTGARASLVVLNTDLDTCCARQKLRARPVPVEAVRRVYDAVRAQLPTLPAEGWHEVIVHGLHHQGSDQRRPASVGGAG